MPHVRRSVIDIHTRIGSRFESAADNGISHFLEHMLHRGTQRYPSAHALAFAFETLGGALSAMTYVDHGALSLGAPPENLSELVRILAEVLLQPIFSGLDVEKGLREEILESLDKDGARWTPTPCCARWLFRITRWVPDTGSLSTLELDIPLLHRHHAARYVAEGSVVTVAGPIDPEAMLAQVADVFKALPNGAEPATVAPAPRTGLRFSHVKYTGSQASVRVGFRAPNLPAPNAIVCFSAPNAPGPYGQYEQAAAAVAVPTHSRHRLHPADPDAPRDHANPRTEHHDDLSRGPSQLAAEDNWTSSIEH